MVLFKVAGYFLYYILIARCWLLFIPYPITGLFDERWTWVAGYLTLRAGVVLWWGGYQQMCTLHAVVVLWVCLRETWTVSETILNTS